ncbi:MAG TPA: hypothetical protein VFI31_11265 [Pirellulales bacterium]|nr:hypothetical protein [Pirellulales bacterium]
MSSFGELATRWTVRLALTGYFIGAGWRSPSSSLSQQRVARLAWTLGCVFYLAHVACAFEYFHHWSHSAAQKSTAKQTAEVTGWHWGGGLYFNYLFAVVWLADTVALWLKPPAMSGRRRWPAMAIQAFMWFMVLNATVVFGHGAVRWFGLAGCSALALRWTYTSARRRANAP